MNRQFRKNRKNNDEEYYILAASLIDRPHTLAEIEDSFSAYYHLFGIFAWQLRLSPRAKEQRKTYFNEGLSKLQLKGWVVFDGECYTLTAIGRTQARKLLEHATLAREFLDSLQLPETASKVSMIVYLVLAAIKLPAGLLSGSVGLINDSLDTLMDSLSSLLVYLGFHFQKERLANIFQVLMLATAGCLTLYQAIMGFLRPHSSDVDFSTFFAAIFSAVVCLGLYFYQRLSGLKYGSFGLITQSVDSRNHIIVALGVTGGLVASLLKFSLLDSLVGLVVASLILKSAVEMAIELFRSFNKDFDLDLSHYRISIPGLEQYQCDQLCDWMLYLVQQGKVKEKQQLIALSEMIVTTSNPVLLSMGFSPDKDKEENHIQMALQQIMEKGWILFEPPLELTPAGKERLTHRMKRHHKQRGYWQKKNRY